MNIHLLDAVSSYITFNIGLLLPRSAIAQEAQEAKSRMIMNEIKEAALAVFCCACVIRALYTLFVADVRVK